MLNTKFIFYTPSSNYEKVCVKLAITYITHANNWFAVFSRYTDLFITISPFIDIPVSLSEAFL